MVINQNVQVNKLSNYSVLLLDSFPFRGHIDNNPVSYHMRQDYLTPFLYHNQTQQLHYE